MKPNTNDLQKCLPCFIDGIKGGGVDIGKMQANLETVESNILTVRMREECIFKKLMMTKTETLYSV